MFGIFASIAEFERELIRERVRSGLALARAQGKRIGRPPRPVDTARVNELPAQVWSWAEIAREMGVGLGTVHRAAQNLINSVEMMFLARLSLSWPRHPGRCLLSGPERNGFDPACAGGSMVLNGNPPVAIS